MQINDIENVIQLWIITQVKHICAIIKIFVVHIEFFACIFLYVPIISSGSSIYYNKIYCNLLLASTRLGFGRKTAHNW